MTDQSLFDTAQETTEQPAATAPDQAQPATTDSSYDSMLQGIKTSDGRQKYATISDALNSIPHKEQHVTQLESELAVLRQELESTKAELAAAQTVGGAINTGTGSTQTGEANTVIDPDSLTATVYQKVRDSMEADRQASTRQERINAFTTKFKSVYGDRSAEVFESKLAEAGLSQDILLDAEVMSPGSAWKFLGLDNTTTVDTQTIPATQRQGQREVEATESAPSFRPTNQAKPGEKFAAQRAETLKRLGIKDI